MATEKVTWNNQAITTPTAWNAEPTPPVGDYALLLETGSYLLLETGGHILLE